MLAGVFHLHEQEARQVMTPIPAVVTVDVSEDAEAALRRCVESGHTRLVVTEDENTDRIKGLVHANSLAQLLMEEGPDASIEGLVRDAPIVPETKPLDDLLADLQRQRSSLAVVVDEYGRTAGVVTVEDIIEEVVGEIADETDPPPAGSAGCRTATGSCAATSPSPTSRTTGWTLPVDTDAYNSVGGFVFAELGRLPKRGDTVAANGFSIRVESVRENRIEAVRISAARAGCLKAPISKRTKAHNALPCRTDRWPSRRLEEERQWWTGGSASSETGPHARAGLVLLGGGAAVRYVAMGTMPTRHEATLSSP